MKKNVRKAFSLALILSLLLGIGAVTATAAAIEVPAIPERPITSASQKDAHETLLPPGENKNNWHGTPYGAWKAGSNTRYFLSDMNYLNSSNTPNNTYSLGQPTTVNHPYSEPDNTFTFGNTSTPIEMDCGIGMHPKNPSQQVLNRQDSWTVYDISAYTASNSATPADTFYSLIGLTSQTNAWGSKYESAGVYVYIYGDKTGDGQHYELLAESSLIRGDTLGEFNVNIKDVKLLLIDVILPETATKHAYSAVGFGGACLFTADPNAQKPDYSDDYKNHKHSYSGWEQHSATQHKSVCSTCGDVVFAAHNWDKGVITTPPTCTTKSVITYTCTDCEYWKVENVDEVHTPSSCTVESDTQHKYTCNCGALETFSDHAYDDVLDADCNECGYQRTIATEDPDASGKSLRSILGCKSSISLSAGLSLLLTFGATGLVWRKKD